MPYTASEYFIAALFTFSINAEILRISVTLTAVLYLYLSYKCLLEHFL
jgi:hypothetical protein